MNMNDNMIRKITTIIATKYSVACYFTSKTDDKLLAVAYKSHQQSLRLRRYVWNSYRRSMARLSRLNTLDLSQRSKYFLVCRQFR